jgi:hypothetical protein
MPDRNKYKKQVVSAGMILLIGTLLFNPLAAFANVKVNALEQKIADLALLYKQLTDRGSQAEMALDALQTQKQELIAEVMLLAKSDQLKTYQQARDNLRIHYNLILLGTIEAYLQAFEAKLRLYQTGCDKLNYLKQLANDDIKMITTLNDLQIDALTTQISLLINRYLPEAHIIQIDPARIIPEAPERVWAALFQP